MLDHYQFHKKVTVENLDMVEEKISSKFKRIKVLVKKRELYSIKIHGKHIRAYAMSVGTMVIELSMLP
jgi:hypothetical protein